MNELMIPSKNLAVGITPVEEKGDLPYIAMRPPDNSREVCFVFSTREQLNEFIGALLEQADDCF